MESEVWNMGIISIWAGGNRTCLILRRLNEGKPLRNNGSILWTGIAPALAL